MSLRPQGYCGLRNPPTTGLTSRYPGKTARPQTPPRDTAYDGAMDTSETPYGALVDAAERQGHDYLLHSDTLPATAPPDVWDLIEEEGGMVHEPDPSGPRTHSGLPLFRKVTLPPGWHKAPLTPPYWVVVRDPGGEARIMCFFKAAPHDFDAFARVTGPVYGGEYE